MYLQGASPILSNSKQCVKGSYNVRYLGTVDAMWFFCILSSRRKQKMLKRNMQL